MKIKTFVLLLLCVTGFLSIRLQQNEMLANRTDETEMDNIDFGDRDYDDDDWDYDDDDDDIRDRDMDKIDDSMIWNLTNFTDNLNLNSTSLSLSLNNDQNLGNYLVGNNGMSLYYFQNDHIGSNFTEQDFNITCYGECAKEWPPVLVTNQNMEVTYGSGLNSNLINSRLRDDGLTQLTYNNIPLYYYERDKQLGDTTGQAVFGSGGYWYLINAEGLPIKS